MNPSQEKTNTLEGESLGGPRSPIHIETIQEVPLPFLVQTLLQSSPFTFTGAHISKCPPFFITNMSGTTSSTTVTSTPSTLVAQTTPTRVRHLSTSTVVSPITRLTSVVSTVGPIYSSLVGFGTYFNIGAWISLVIGLGKNTTSTTITSSIPFSMGTFSLWNTPLVHTFFGHQSTKNQPSVSTLQFDTTQNLGTHPGGGFIPPSTNPAGNVTQNAGYIYG